MNHYDQYDDQSVSHDLLEAFFSFLPSHQSQYKVNTLVVASRGTSRVMGVHNQLLQPQHGWLPRLNPPAVGRNSRSIFLMKLGPSRQVWVTGSATPACGIASKQSWDPGAEPSHFVVGMSQPSIPSLELDSSEDFSTQCHSTSLGRSLFEVPTDPVV